jgi:hypothetical protein
MPMNRRTFLRTSVAAGLSIGFPAVVNAQRDKTYRLVGYEHPA